MENNIILTDKITVDEYNSMREAVGWYLAEATQTEESLRNSVYIITARENGRIVGMARLIGDGVLYFFLVDVIVHPEYQGKGIGRLLVENILEFIRSNRKTGQFFSVQLSAAKGKEGFYEKFGFQTRPNENTGCGMGLMFKD